MTPQRRSRWAGATGVMVALGLMGCGSGDGPSEQVVSGESAEYLVLDEWSGGRGEALAMDETDSLDDLYRQADAVVVFTVTSEDPQVDRFLGIPIDRLSQDDLFELQRPRFVDAVVEHVYWAREGVEIPRESTFFTWGYRVDLDNGDDDEGPTEGGTILRANPMGTMWLEVGKTFVAAVVQEQQEVREGPFSRSGVFLGAGTGFEVLDDGTLKAVEASPPGTPSGWQPGFEAEFDGKPISVLASELAEAAPAGVTLDLDYPPGASSPSPAPTATD